MTKRYKKNKTQKKHNSASLIDLSLREDLKIEPCNTLYDEKEIIDLIKKFDKQSQNIKLKYYSTNLFIDKIEKRTFWGILQDRWKEFYLKIHKSNSTHF